MLRRASAIALLAIVLGVFAQTSSAAPVNAKNAFFVTAVCGSSQFQVVLNGNGDFTPGHVIGDTSLFIPTAYDLTFTFTPAGGGTPEVDSETAAKPRQPADVVTCQLPGALNTVTDSEGTFTLDGTVTGFFTPNR